MAELPESELGLAILDWEIDLEARDLSEQTISSYMESARLLDKFLVSQGITELADIDRKAIQLWVIDQGRKVSPGTVLTRFRSVRVLFNWLTEIREEYVRSPMHKLREPRNEDRPPAVPDAEDVTRMLSMIDGKGFNDRRDLALLRFLFDSGCRMSEVVNVTLADVDVRARTAVVYGKGRKVRTVSFGAKTSVGGLELSAGTAETSVRVGEVLVRRAAWPDLLFRRLPDRHEAGPRGRLRTSSTSGTPFFCARVAR